MYVVRNMICETKELHVFILMSMLVILADMHHTGVCHNHSNIELIQRLVHKGSLHMIFCCDCWQCDKGYPSSSDNVANDKVVLSWNRSWHGPAEEANGFLQKALTLSLCD